MAYYSLYRCAMAKVRVDRQFSIAVLQEVTSSIIVSLCVLLIWGRNAFRMDTFFRLVLMRTSDMDDWGRKAPVY